MAETQADKNPSLSEQYSLEKDKKPDMGSKPEEVKEIEIPVKAGEEEAVDTAVSTGESTEASSDPVEENTEANSAPVEESTEASSAAADDSSEAAPAATEESSEAVEEEKSADEEVAEETKETREIKLETAPADFRFPTTNQTRHCFTRYIEYHRCVAAKGEDDATECDKFAKYYRSLCPTEWVERWNEQRENGTFPGPL